MANPYFLNIKGTIDNQFTLGDESGVIGPTIYTGPNSPVYTIGSNQRSGDVYIQGGNSLVGNPNIFQLNGTNWIPLLPNINRIILTDVTYIAHANQVIKVVLTAACTITLPPNPVPGNFVIVGDAGLNVATYNVTILGNGSNIDSSASNSILNTNGQQIEFTYLNSTVGWRSRSM